MIIRPVETADSPHWLRMRMALWPDSHPAKEMASDTTPFYPINPAATAGH